MVRILCFWDVFAMLSKLYLIHKHVWLLHLGPSHLMLFSPYKGRKIVNKEKGCNLCTMISPSSRLMDNRNRSMEFRLCQVLCQPSSLREVVAGCGLSLVS